MKTLRASLVTLVAAGLLALAALGAVNAFGGNHSNQAVQRTLVAKDLTADILPPPLYLIELRLVLGMAVDGTLDAAAADKQRTRLVQEYGDRIAHWNQHPPVGLDPRLMATQHAEGQRFIDASASVISTLAAGDRDAAMKALQQSHALYVAHRAGVDGTVRAANALATESLARSVSINRQLKWIDLAGVLLASVGLSILGWVTLRSVMRATGGEPVEVARIANAVAQGDLTVQVTLKPGDSTSAMAAMARMCQTLRGLVSTVQASSDGIASGSQQIETGNLDLSVRTEQQAASLQQTASAMEQFAGTVRNSADSARAATLLAEGASSVAGGGAAVVGDVISTMQEIAVSSRRIGEITSVIDGIAFQTNILALNAAVEAARAGEQGRGFAVVASEVRSLAQRSAAAAREINGLIDQSVQRVEAGTQLVASAGATMREIVSQVQQVTTLINEISTAAAEQTQGIGLVSSAVNQLDSATQQNAALVEESAAAAGNLKQQAEGLVRAVSHFKLAAA